MKWLQYAFVGLAMVTLAVDTTGATRTEERRMGTMAEYHGGTAPAPTDEKPTSRPTPKPTKFPTKKPTMAPTFVGQVVTEEPTASPVWKKGGWTGDAWE